MDRAERTICSFPIAALGILLSWLVTSVLALNFRVERVKTRERNLDASVFRGWSPSPAEFVQGQIEDGGESTQVMTEGEAADHLATLAAPWLSGEDEDDRETFVAVLVPITPNGEEEEEDDDDDAELRHHLSTRGVVGCVDLTLRNHPSFGKRRRSHDHPSLDPHWDVSNLRVHDGLRRRGVGAALLAAATDHARSRTDLAWMVTLDVSEDNAGAIGLYEREGFVSSPEGGTGGGFMVKDLRK